MHEDELTNDEILNIYHVMCVCSANASLSYAHVQGNRRVCCITEQAKLCVSIHACSKQGWVQTKEQSSHVNHVQKHV